MTNLNVYAAVDITGEFAYGNVCRDCTFVLANGSLDEDWRTMDQRNLAEKNWGIWEFTLGHHHTGKWAERCWHRGNACDDDCQCERTDFDTFNACDMCGNTDAGYRHHVTMIKRELLDTKMTKEQFDKLLILCDRYEVSMAISDYVVFPQDSFTMPGWAEGWIGGPNHNGGFVAKRKTIYVGVSPQGDSHS